MAKKKVNKVTKKKTKKVVQKTSSNTNSNKQDVARFNLAWKNLIFFALLSFLFSGLYSYSTQELYMNLFLLLSMISGFLSLAFFIAFLVFLFKKAFK